MAQPIGSFAGIGSGFDYRDLVDQIILSEAFPIAAAKSRIDLATAQLNAYGAYRSALVNLESATKALGDGSAFKGVSTTVMGATNSAGRTVLSAAANAGATPGRYSITVSQLAQSHKVSSISLQADESAVEADGIITLNGRDILIEAGDTLEIIADKINSANESAPSIGVSASVISDTSLSKRLVLTSVESGSAGISISSASGIDAALGLSTIVTGQDAHFSIDGVSMVRSSNTISDVIANFSMTLTEADPSTVVQVSVERSVSYAEGAIGKFVEAYNAVIDFLQAQQSVQGNSKGGPLYNNPTLRLARTSLASVILDGNTQGDGISLSQLGISLDKSGRLTFDAAKFKTSFADDLAGARDRLQQLGDDFAIKIDSWVGAAGTIALNERTLNERITAQEAYMDRVNDRLELRKQILLKQFLAMDVTVQRLNSQGNAFLTAITSAQSDRNGR